MRVVITGATGNTGTSLIKHLIDDPEITEVLGIARRKPDVAWEKVTWVAADVSSSDLVPTFKGADAVVHLAWLIQPSRDPDTLMRTNIQGSRRVFEAVTRAEVPALVYASSVGAYSPGPKDRTVDESWPVGGIPSSFYSRHKARVETILDEFEGRPGAPRVVRFRPALIFKREAGPAVRRLFLGPLVPTTLIDRSFISLLPWSAGLAFQAVHSMDVGAAYHHAIKHPVKGAFNLAADPVLDEAEMTRFFGASTVKLPKGLLRAGAAATWRARLQPTPEGWVDMGFGAPLMSSDRARSELGWVPAHTSIEALTELLEGIKGSPGLETPPLKRDAGGPARIREILTGMGGRT